MFKRLLLSLVLVTGVLVTSHSPVSAGPYTGCSVIVGEPSIYGATGVVAWASVYCPSSISRVAYIYMQRCTSSCYTIYSETEYPSSTANHFSLSVTNCGPFYGTYRAKVVMNGVAYYSAQSYLPRDC